MPINDVALGFGSAMFAFEGISVVLPVYKGLKDPNRMSGLCGIINVSFSLLLTLYFSVGLLGFLKFGRDTRDSITLNLPAEPIYDAVRAMFAMSILLTYPLQFYVPNQIISTWIKGKLINIGLLEGDINNMPPILDVHAIIPAVKVTERENQDKFDTMTTNSTISTTLTNSTDVNISNNNDDNEMKKGVAIFESPKTVEDGVGKVAKNIDTSRSSSIDSSDTTKIQLFEYGCRTGIVLVTFIMAMSVPKLNLLMDLVGSITGTALSLIIPALIHMAAYWEITQGLNKLCLITIDFMIIIVGLLAGFCGAIISMSNIINSFS